MTVKAAEIAGLVLLGAVLVVGLLAVRRVRFVRRGGVDVALRLSPDRAASRWHLGVARYQGDEFVWYRVGSLRSGPDTVVHRRGLAILARRTPAGSEAYAMPSSATVLRCRGRNGELELAMAPDALTGFLSWLESAPPGHAVPWAS